MEKAIHSLRPVCSRCLARRGDHHFQVRVKRRNREAFSVNLDLFNLVVVSRWTGLVKF